MTDNRTPPFFVTEALRVRQPMGTFYVAVLPARVLLDVAFTDLTSARARADGRGYEIEGTQRFRQDKRLDEIAAFLRRGDAAIPNSIIVAGNYRQEDGLIEEDEAPEQEGAPAVSRRWTLAERNDGCLELTIPTPAKLAAVIDGQHRLFAFARVASETADPLDMDLICSIYMDLPKPYQASLFATVNSTQKRVDRSLTYELFGYNVDEEPPESWTPDKLAVYLTRLLGTDNESPLRARIAIAPEKDAELRRLAAEGDWRVSTAVVVDGVLKLFSANPKRDSNRMASSSRPRRSLLEVGRDKSPLRPMYIAGTQDEIIYRIVRNYLEACDRVFWQEAEAGSFITKTVGVQALFDVLRHIAAAVVAQGSANAERFEEILRRAEGADFTEDRFRNASGSGRSIIRREIEQLIGGEFFPAGV